MRTNKKQQLLATAMDIVESDGLQGLTYDSLSTATGTSKSGLDLSFPVPARTRSRAQQILC